MDTFNFFPNVRKGDDAFIGIICGMKGSGKTTLLMDLLNTVWKHVFNLIVIVSPTFGLQDISSEIIDGRGILVFSEWRPCIIDQIIEYQTEKRNKKREIENNETIFKPKVPEDHHILLIFDDIGSLGKEGKLSIQMANLSYVVRHYNVSMIELAQRVTLLSTGLSSQANFYIFFCEQNPNERQNIQRRVCFSDNKKKWWEIFDRETLALRSWVGIRNVYGRNFFFNINGFIYE